MYLSSPLSSRNQFPGYLNERGLIGEAVEIGTHRADFAHSFRSRWDGAVLHCVDPWSTPEGYEYQAESLWGGDDRDGDYEVAKQKMGEFGTRAVLHRTTSRECAVGFHDASVDFVYLDGDHRYEHVLHDLARWWTKLKPGGILAGHDVVCPGPVEPFNWGGGIQRAISDFLESQFKEIHVDLIVEPEGLPWSYHMEKP